MTRARLPFRGAGPSCPTSERGGRRALLGLGGLEHQSPAVLHAFARAQAGRLLGALVADGQGHGHVGTDRLAELHLPADRAEHDAVLLALLHLELSATEPARDEARLVAELEDALLYLAGVPLVRD